MLSTPCIGPGIGPRSTTSVFRFPSLSGGLLDPQCRSTTDEPISEEIDDAESGKDEARGPSADEIVDEFVTSQR